MKLFVFLTLLTSLNIHAFTTYHLTSNSPSTVDEFANCKALTNTSAANYMVPTGSANEWSTFLNHMPNGVSAGSCCTQNPMPATRTETNCTYLSNAVCATQVRPVDRYCDNDFAYCSTDSCTGVVTCTHTYTYGQRVACCIDASTANCDNPPSP